MSVEMCIKPRKEQTSEDITDKQATNKIVKTSYQPIVSLSNGSIFAFQAVNELIDSNYCVQLEDIFKQSKKTEAMWELEIICKMNALENATSLNKHQKLFLKAYTCITYDEAFRIGYAKDFLADYGLDLSNLVSEIAEDAALSAPAAFVCSIKHYRNQQHKFALSGIDSKDSVFNDIAAIRPNYVKLDPTLTKNIDRDKTKQHLCKSYVQLCEQLHIPLIATGVETAAELRTLIRLKVSLGQGSFLFSPVPAITDTVASQLFPIDKYCQIPLEESIYPMIGNLAKPGHQFPSDTTVEAVYDAIKHHPSITEFTVIHDDKAIGFMTRTRLNEIIGGMYGFSLCAKKPVFDLIKDNFLCVDFRMSSEQVSQLAMQRSQECLYDAVVVEEDGDYAGIVTIKDLLTACSTVEMDMAIHSNPLTKLPGNMIIDHKIKNRISGSKPYCITYYDLDNFKAYNDAYGFQKGDLMLKLLADVLKSCAEHDEFVGHIGGDDFIVICDYHEGELYCQSVIDKFATQVTSLYNTEDIENGYIISKNRAGAPERFPIATLSIAGISNKHTPFENMLDFSKEITRIKKKCKKTIGNCFEIA